MGDLQEKSESSGYEIAYKLISEKELIKCLNTDGIYLVDYFGELATDINVSSLIIDLVELLNLDWDDEKIQIMKRALLAIVIDKRISKQRLNNIQMHMTTKWNYKSFKISDLLSIPMPMMVGAKLFREMWQNNTSEGYEAYELTHLGNVIDVFCWQGIEIEGVLIKKQFTTSTIPEARQLSESNINSEIIAIGKENLKLKLEIDKLKETIQKLRYEADGLKAQINFFHYKEF